MTTADIVDIIEHQTRKATTLEQDQAAEESIERLFGKRVRSAAWLDRQEFPPLEEIIPGVLPEGLGMIAAPPKTGKSWFACALGLACAQGGYALGHIKVESRPVFYFALEDGHRRLQSRLRKLNNGQPLPEYLMVITEAKNLTEVIVLAEHFQDKYSTMAPPLIIIDTLGRVSPGRAASQSQYEADYQTGARLQNLAKRVPGSAVLVLHHTNKGAHADFLDSVSGTQGVAGAYDSILVLKRERKSKDGILSVTGRDIENETEYGINSDEGQWQLIGGTLHSAETAVEQIRKTDHANNLGDLQQSILQAVNELKSGNTTTPAAIAHGLGIDSKTASKYLGRLLDSGLIQRQGRGRYAPLTTPPVESVESVVNAGQHHQTISTPTVESVESESISTPLSKPVSKRKPPITSHYDTFDTYDTP